MVMTVAMNGMVRGLQRQGLGRLRASVEITCHAPFGPLCSVTSQGPRVNIRTPLSGRGAKNAS
jgi:hypothetical protein